MIYFFKNVFIKKKLLTNKSSWSLLSYFNAKRAGHVRFLAVAFNWNIPFLVKFIVSPANILSIGIGIAAALITANSLATCNNALNYWPLSEIYLEYTL